MVGAGDQWLGQSVRTIKNWWGLGSGWVGLHLESMFLDGLFGSSSSWLSIAGGPCRACKAPDIKAWMRYGLLVVTPEVSFRTYARLTVGHPIRLYATAELQTAGSGSAHVSSPPLPHHRLRLPGKDQIGQ